MAAMTILGGSFLSASLQVIFDRMASRGFLNLFRGTRKQNEKLLQKLNDMLLTVNLVLDDADNKQFTNPAVKEWLDGLQHVVYQADDLVDEVATRGAMQLQDEAEEKSISTRLLNLMPFSTDPFHKEMESKLENITERLDYFVKHKDVLGLKQVTGRQLMSTRLPTTSLVDETCVYGRNDEKEEIVKLLMSDEARTNQISVIAIVGMGGIGKTTIVQLVYNDERVNKYFEKKAWVCVSEPFDVFLITESILEAITSADCHIKDNLDRLQEELHHNLNQQKFLIVLDDVWTESFDDWDLLRRPFKSGSDGSKVIVTTRSSGVASVMQTVPSRYAKELSDEDCWSLFSSCAFGNEDPCKYPNLEVIGKEIVRKCGGLPLAAKTLGGLLRSKLDVTEWEYIRKSEIWDLPNNKSNIIPSLILSYQHLPAHIKRCFTYCSTFPKDYEYDKDELILLWMAHNMLEQQPKSKMTLEDMGDVCFRELLSRSFFQHSFGSKSRFVMHDLIHDLAQFIAGEFCYRLDGETQTRDISEKVRHCSYCRRFIFGYHSDSIEEFKKINDMKNLRGFFLAHSNLPSKILQEMLQNLRCLRVLCCSSYYINELPDSISNLTLLRYFDVSHTNIKSLPESITTLYNLQTLLLSECWNLTKLPQNMGKLCSLRRLDLRGTPLKEMPVGMDQLKNLQFLSRFTVGKSSGSRIDALRKLGDLHDELSISGLENVINKKDVYEANLKGKKHLEVLVLEWNTCTYNFQHAFDLLDELQPHTNLKNLTIKNYCGECFPSWLGGDLLYNMISLTLEHCENCIILPPLGQLPSLKNLTISGFNQIIFVDREFYGDHLSLKPFQSLETLEFRGLIQWEKWNMINKGEFACLEELYVVDCPKITGKLPDRVVTLRRLEISGCHQLVASNRDEQIAGFCNQVGFLEQCLSSLKRLVISDIPTLVQLPQELSNLKNLQELEIVKCRMLESFPDTGLPCRLTVLTVEGCYSLKSFPSGGLQAALKTLKIKCCRGIELPNEMEKCYSSIVDFTLVNSCDSLESFPLSSCPELKSLCIYGCNIKRLSVVNRGDGYHIRLQNVSIASCPNLTSCSFGCMPAPYLTEFRISNCKNVKSLPSFPSLQSLWIKGCPEVEWLTEGSLSPSLNELSISNCEKLMGRIKKWGLQTFPSLSWVEFAGESKWETFPEEWLLPSSLRWLEITGCENLKRLNNKGLQHLTNLTYLSFTDCPQLQTLSENVLPGSINELVIENCSPLLKQRLLKKKGDDWAKISHIPLIRIDDAVL